MCRPESLGKKWHESSDHLLKKKPGQLMYSSIEASGRASETEIPFKFKDSRYHTKYGSRGHLPTCAVSAT